MNARIQVEHTVTEMRDRDLLQAQLYLMQHDKLPFSQDDIVFNGHVIEARINAKIQKRNFNLPLVKLKVTFTSRFQHTCRFSALSWVSSITLL